MSRIGKLPIAIPQGVNITLDDQTITVKGAKGTLERKVIDRVKVNIEAEQVVVSPLTEDKQDWAYQGLTRALVNNMVVGVTQGFEKVLLISGVGYRAEAKGNVLNLSLGYSHPIEYKLPEGITAEVEKQTTITVKGIDKELVGAAAAKIRSFRKPEPYKGKGIKYADERVIRKAGKTGK